jgi:hypothetical protein
MHHREKLVRRSGLRGFDEELDPILRIFPVEKESKFKEFLRKEKMEILANLNWIMLGHPQNEANPDKNVLQAPGDRRLCDVQNVRDLVLTELLQIVHPSNLIVYLG